MKKLLIILSVMLYGITADAQTIYNNNQTGCDLVVTKFCYDPSNCNVTSTSSPTSFPAMTQVPVSSFGSACPTGEATGYIVGYADPSCSQTITVEAPGSPSNPACWPTGGPFAECSGCNAGGSLTIQVGPFFQLSATP